MKKTACYISFILFPPLFYSPTLQAQSNRFGESPFETSLKVKDKNTEEIDNGNENDNPHYNSSPGDAPIDGGIAVLLATGVVYGFKKVKDRRQEARQETRPEV